MEAPCSGDLLLVQSIFMIITTLLIVGSFHPHMDFELPVKKKKEGHVDQYTIYFPMSLALCAFF